MELHIEHATINITAPPGAANSILQSFERAGFRSARADLAQAGLLGRPALGEAWAGQGGIYVATIPAMLGAPARHLIASNEECKRRFGPTGTDLANSHIDGPANTHALRAAADEYPAARWCGEYRADGHADFHLPSRFDLLMAYFQAPQVFNKEGWYWSSTQVSRDYAFAQDFAYGHIYWSDKDGEFRVRAFRWIHA